MKISPSVALLVLGALAVSTHLAQGSDTQSLQQRNLRALGKADNDRGDDYHKVCTITKEAQCDGQSWTGSKCCADDKYECRLDDKGKKIKRCQLKKKDDDCSDDKPRHGGKPGHDYKPEHDYKPGHDYNPGHDYQPGLGWKIDDYSDDKHGWGNKYQYGKGGD